jgi:acetyl-CoA/propionyl-CoA carboxylase, biotin carboxylase, biotin carboxyl carrier protein
VHTRWIETEWAGGIPPFTGAAELAEAGARETVVVEVGGKRLEVTLPRRTESSPAPRPRRERSRTGHAAAGGDALTSPMQGTIVKIAVADGDQVSEGDLIVVLEAMKMEQPLNAHKSGTVSGLAASVGDVVSAGAVICQIADG